MTTDGTKTYTRSTSTSTTTTDEKSNQAVYQFVVASSLYYETERQIYQGAASGTPLQQQQTCYNAATACTTTALTLPIAQLDTYNVLNGVQESGITAKYNTYGFQTELDNYDFGGSSARGSLLRKEVWTYPSTGIVSLLSSDEVYDGSGNEAGLSKYTYDNSTPTATSGLPQHSGAIGSQRGNLATVAQYFSASSALGASYSYEDTGNPTSVVTPNGTSTYTYDAATHGFLTTATPPTPSSGISLPTGATSDANTGLPLTATDPNSATVTYQSYDPLLRPLEIDNPIGKTTFAYPSANQVSQYSYQSASVHTDNEQLVDSYGRPNRSALSNGQSTNPWYQKDTCYDATSNVSFIFLSLSVDRIW